MDGREQQADICLVEEKPVLMTVSSSLLSLLGPTVKAFVHVLCDSFLEPYGPVLHSFCPPVSTPRMAHHSPSKGVVGR